MLGCVTKSLGGQQFEGNYCAPLLVAGSNAEYNGECQDLHVTEEWGETDPVVGDQVVRA